MWYPAKNISSNIFCLDTYLLFVHKDIIDLIVKESNQCVQQIFIKTDKLNFFKSENYSLTLLYSSNFYSNNLCENVSGFWVVYVNAMYFVLFSYNKIKI